jgi:hypothetical protein
MSVMGQTQLFDDVDAMSAAPPIATECCSAVSGASNRAEVAASLPVRERMLLFCIASATDWLLARITGETVVATLEKGLVERDTTGRISLTDHGRDVLRAMLPDL